MRTPDRRALRFDEAGLIPAIVQDAGNGQVLMLAYMNAEALEATERTGEVHFWSRRRNELWHKGATSGNTLRCVGIAADCDGDALLVTAEPSGPACHTGATSCFAAEAEIPGTLAGLWATIVARRADRPEGSYTVALLDGGVDACARKVLEEAGEVAFAAKDHAGDGSPARVIEESADLIYHLIVLLAERGLELDGVMTELEERAR